jgi:NTP pyrophosphatase (non-canonical NTP hydrolase)
MSKSLSELQEELVRFRDARGWKKFHEPNSLAAAISVEAAELLEIFLWKSGEEAHQSARENHDRVVDEIADIMIFTINLANRLEIDLESAISEKISVNAYRFPSDGHADSPPSRKL